MAQAPMRVLSSQGDLVDSYDPARRAPHRVLLKRAGVRVLYREADPVRGPAGGAAPAHGRRREPQGAISKPGAVRGCRRSTRCCGGGYRGQRLAGLAHEIFLKLLKAKREVPGAAERQKTLAAQDGKCALAAAG